SGDNLYEATQNLRDRALGLSLKIRERLESWSEFASWLSSSEGVIWLLREAALALCLFVFVPWLRTRRDKLLIRLVVHPMEQRGWIATGRVAYKTIELVREALAPAAALLVAHFFFEAIPARLDEFELLHTVLKKLIVLVFASNAIRVLFIPYQVRRERERSVAPFAVNLFAMEPRTAGLLALSFRVWIFYAIISSALIDVVQWLFGLGFSPHLFEVLAAWGQLILVYVLCFLWRNVIVENFVKITRKAAEGDEEQVEIRRSVRLIRAHKDRIYSVLFLGVIATFLLTRLSYRFARDQLFTLSFFRRIESRLLRRRMRAGQGRDTTELTVDFELPSDYRKTFELGPILPTGLFVPRPEAQGNIRAALQTCTESDAAGAIAV
ncbi:MAG: hypothetical protein KC561_20410, partial [Myxococcales bacterium]|nr:hypothetical protein [Myxococcales bacterium]